MDSDRFDRWTKLFAVRMSRRTAATAVGAAAVTSLVSTRLALGQDDDDDDNDNQESGVDERADDPTADNPDDDVQQGDDETLGEFPCLPIRYCMRLHCNDLANLDGSGECHWDMIGNIPGQPYEQEWVWANFPDACTPKDRTWRELEALCNETYPGDFGIHACNNECQACTLFSAWNCH